MSRVRSLALSLALVALASACSVRRLAVGGLAEALAGSSAAFAREDDPELVREAMPFALKAIEAVLIETPENETLLAAASAGFGLYAYAFLQLDAEQLASTDYARAEALRARALALHLRARDYALRALELRHPGLGARLRRAPAAAAGELGRDDLELAYLAGGTWGLAVALGKDDPALLADVDAVRALLRRSLELDESYDEGALHEAMISVEGLPRAMGGSPERAREHYRRALELSGGKRASLYLKLAENVSVPAQDRVEFERLLGLALAVDLEAEPDQRLSNRITMGRARHLLATIDDLFLPPLE
jgi:TRAP transporter TatT component family protein